MKVSHDGINNCVWDNWTSPNSHKVFIRSILLHLFIKRVGYFSKDVHVVLLVFHIILEFVFIHFMNSLPMNRFGLLKSFQCISDRNRLLSNHDSELVGAKVLHILVNPKTLVSKHTIHILIQKLTVISYVVSWVLGQRFGNGGVGYLLLSSHRRCDLLWNG